MADPTPEQVAKAMSQQAEAIKLLEKMKQELAPYSPHLGIDIENLNIITACGYCALIQVRQSRYLIEQLESDGK